MSRQGMNLRTGRKVPGMLYCVGDSNDSHHRLGSFLKWLKPVGIIYDTNVSRQLGSPGGSVLKTAIQMDFTDI
jgi:hypothetical protein